MSAAPQLIQVPSEQLPEYRRKVKEQHGSSLSTNSMSKLRKGGGVCRTISDEQGNQRKDSNIVPMPRLHNEVAVCNPNNRASKIGSRVTYRKEFPSGFIIANCEVTRIIGEWRSKPALHKPACGGLLVNLWLNGELVRHVLVDEGTGEAQ